MRRIALLTDFGTADPYVAAVKGVLAWKTDAPVHDLSHELPPFDAFAAGWFLRAAVDYWPRETIFMTVVDPGVGTTRRILGAEWNERFFLAPDNGLLSLVLGASARVHSLENPELFLPNGSTTFHGRDRIAPAAAALANGSSLNLLGPRVETIERLDYTPPDYTNERVTGTVVEVDRFGNVITDIEAARVPFAPFAMVVSGRTIDRTRTDYDEVDEHLFLIVGSTGRIEISVSRASAAERLQLSRFARVELWPNERR